MLPWIKQKKEILEAEEQKEKKDEILPWNEETLPMEHAEVDEAEPGDLGTNGDEEMDGDEIDPHSDLEQVVDGTTKFYDVKFSTEHMMPLRKIKYAEAGMIKAITL